MTRVKCATVLLIGILAGAVPLPAQLNSPISQLNWTSVHVVLMSDSSAGVKVFLITEPQSRGVPYLFHEQAFVPAEASAWVAVARLLLADSGHLPVTLVARDSSLLVLARERGRHDPVHLDYYGPPDSGGAKPLDIRLSTVDAGAFLDSLDAKILVSHFDSNAPRPDSSVVLAEQIREPPHIESMGAFEYPEDLRQMGLEGTVVLQVIVDSTGRADPKSIKVISATNPGFSAAAIEAVRKTRFRPGRLNGHALRVLLAVPIRFTLMHNSY